MQYLKQVYQDIMTHFFPGTKLPSTWKRPQTTIKYACVTDRKKQNKQRNITELETERR